jgi:transposase InsO family protein
VSSLHRTEVFVSHRNARLTVHGRRLLVERVRCGRPVAHVAAEMGISRATAHKWIRRWRSEGEAGLADRSSRPRTTPHRTAATVEARVCHLRQARKPGPARLGPVLGLPASTVHRILVRHGLNRLAHLDRPTGQVIRRYERARPGELVHVDVKKLGRIPDGGGHKVLGRQAGRARRSSMGFDYIHSAVDDHSRLAYSEVHADEKAVTCADFLRRAAAFFAEHGITRIERVLTDNAWPYRKSFAWRQTLADLGAAGKLTRIYRPQTNGKVERFNRTLLDEWAYLRPYTSNTERTDALADFLHTYNHHRCHTALGGKPPISRVNNAAGQYS